MSIDKLQQWRSHKVVSAGEILQYNYMKNIEVATGFDASGSATSVVIEPDTKFWARSVQARTTGDNGVFVVYDDGYQSWSPTKAFVEGYTLVREDKDDDNG